MPEKIKKISIIGLGVSGLAAAEKLSRQGERVFVSEIKQRKDIDRSILAKLDPLNVQTEFGKHSGRVIEDTKLLIMSPGVDPDQDIIRKARKKRIQIISEVELAFSFLKKPIIAVTGTNGKTTTVELIASILRDGRLNTVAAGNIGFPLIKVNDARLDYIVAEISSYQLEGIRDFRPLISAILNVTEDHLLRHKSMKNYMLSKARIFENQGQGDYLVYNHDDPIVRGLSKKAKCAKIPFSIKRGFDNGIYIEGGRIIANILGKKTVICRTTEVRIKGTHNLENTLAAVAIAIICGITAESIRKTLKRFKGVEHRIEYVRKVKGVSFYNDSKGTNPDSTITAVNAISPSSGIVLILGGRDKKTSLTKLASIVKKKVKNVVLIGEAAERIRKSLEDIGYDKISSEDSIVSAVRRSLQLAQKGDAVLLSPACASFDMFSNYEERGRIFKRIVNRLARR